MWCDRYTVGGMYMLGVLYVHVCMLYGMCMFWVYYVSAY